MNPHTILGTNKYSTEDDVRLAYRRLMKKHHPDSGDGDVDKLNEAKTAYSQLRDIPPIKELTVRIVVLVTQAELVTMLGTTELFEYAETQFKVFIPYSVRMGDTISVPILTDTKLKIKFKESNE
ncbi:J domain-containing protein [bacterium]|nr:J domain-containing protein [bacterium]